MTGRSGLALLLCALLSACIPPGAPVSSGQNPQRQQQPRLDPGPIDTVYGETPVWEARPVTPAAQEIEQGAYVVQPGDNLHRIGEKTGAGADALARANNLQPPYTLRVGQRLVVPQGRFHRVAAGESGIAIARAYGVPWAVIVERNALVEPYTLRVGQRLIIPGAAAPQREPRAGFSLDIEDILTGGEPADAVGAAPAQPVERPSAALPPTVSVAEPPRFAGGFIWPVTGRPTNRFGPAGPGEVNDGLDIAVPQGAPIVASSDGVVAFVGSDVAGYGGVILIRHGDGWITAYGRAARASVTRGQSVRRGQIIGYAGTGATPTVHFEMRQGRVPVDPLKYLPSQ